MTDRVIVEPWDARWEKHDHGRTGDPLSIAFTTSFTAGEFTATIYHVNTRSEYQPIIEALKTAGVDVTTPDFYMGRNAQFHIYGPTMIEAVTTLLVTVTSLSNPDKLTFGYRQRARDDRDTTYDAMAGESDKDSIWVVPVGQSAGRMSSTLTLTHEFLCKVESMSLILRTIKKMKATGLCAEVTPWLDGTRLRTKVELNQGAVADLPATYQILAEQFPLRTGIF